MERYYGTALFLFALFWFYFPGEYVLIANQDVSLFFTTSEHFLSFLDRPGGMLEYLGHFITQFYRFRLAGALILSALIVLSYFLTIWVSGKASGNKNVLIMALIAPVLLMGMHNFYPHQLNHSLGLLIAMIFAILLPEDRGKRRIFQTLSVPLLYFLTGGFVWFYCILILAAEFSRSFKGNVEILLSTLVYPALIILLSSVLIFVYPIKQLLLINLPMDQSYPIPLLPYLFAGWVILMILLARLNFLSTFLKTRWSFVPESLLLIAGAFLIFNFTYNRKNVDFFTIEKLAIKEDWDGLLRYAEQHPSTNLFGSFYTNLAMVNQGLLCSSLFDYPQTFGRRGLCFGWEAKDEILKRGSDFFWTINFVNEAHHWAFESMIVNGFTGRNLKRLIQTELARGNMGVAQKYIGLLEKTLFDKKLARHFKTFTDHPETIGKDRELGPSLNTVFKYDFFTDGMDLEKNLRSMINNDPENHPAFDYLMALLLLEKRVDEITQLLPAYAKLTEGKLPQLLEESLLIYNLLHKEEIFTDMAVSQSTMLRFDKYFKVLQRSRDQNQAARTLFPEYGNTFWFHMNFGTIPSY